MEEIFNIAPPKAKSAPTKQRRNRKSRLQRLEQQQQFVPVRATTILTSFGRETETRDNLLSKASEILEAFEKDVIAEQKKYPAGLNEKSLPREQKHFQEKLKSYATKISRLKKTLSDIKDTSPKIREYYTAREDAMKTKILLEAQRVPRTRINHVDAKGLLTTPHQVHVYQNNFLTKFSVENKKVPPLF